MKQSIIKKLLIIKCKSQTEKKLFEQTLKAIAEMEGVEMVDIRTPVGGGFSLDKGNF